MFLISLPPFGKTCGKEVFYYTATLFQCMNLLFEFICILENSLAAVPFHSLQNDPLKTFKRKIWTDFLIRWVPLIETFPLVLFYILYSFTVEERFFLFSRPPFIFFNPILSNISYRFNLSHCYKRFTLLVNEIFKEKSRILSVFIKNIQLVQCSYPYQYAFIYVSNSFNMRITQR